jgi:hypothetical protein
MRNVWFELGPAADSAASSEPWTVVEAKEELVRPRAALSVSRRPGRAPVSERRTGRAQSNG